MRKCVWIDRFMETTSKKLTEEAGIVPRLQLGNKTEGGGVESTGPHNVIFKADRTVKGKHPVTLAERAEVQYTFTEGGSDKTYNVAVKNTEGKLNYFIIRMAEFNYGDPLVLEMKKKGIKNFIDINYDSKQTTPGELPTIQADEGNEDGESQEQDESDSIPYPDSD